MWRYTKWSYDTVSTEEDAFKTIAEAAQPDGPRAKRTVKPVQRYNDKDYAPPESPPPVVKKRKRDHNQDASQQHVKSIKQTRQSHGQNGKDGAASSRDGMTAIKEEELDEEALKEALGITDAQLEASRRWRSMRSHLTPEEYEQAHVAAFGCKPRWDAKGNWIPEPYDSEDEMIEANMNAHYEMQYKEEKEFQALLEATYSDPESWATSTKFSRKAMFPHPDQGSRLGSSNSGRNGVRGAINRQERRATQAPRPERSLVFDSGAARKGLGRRQNAPVRRDDLMDLEADENSAEDADYDTDPDGTDTEDSESDKPLPGDLTDGSQGRDAPSATSQITNNPQALLTTADARVQARQSSFVSRLSSHATEKVAARSTTTATASASCPWSFPRLQKILGHTPDHFLREDGKGIVFAMHCAEFLNIGEHFYHRRSPYFDTARAGRNKTSHDFSGRLHTVLIRDSFKNSHEELTAAFCDSASCSVCDGESGMDPQAQKQRGDGMFHGADVDHGRHASSVHRHWPWRSFARDEAVGRGRYESEYW